MVNRFLIISVWRNTKEGRTQSLLIRGKAFGIFPFMIDLDTDGAFDSIIKLKNTDADDAENYQDKMDYFF